MTTAIRRTHSWSAIGDFLHNKQAGGCRGKFQNIILCFVLGTSYLSFSQNRAKHKALRPRVVYFRAMRVLGIDPGSQTTGWGVVEGNGRRYSLVAFGSIRASSSLKFSTRLLKMCNGLEEVIAEHRPDACALEDAFLATNVKVSMKLGQVRGVALLVAERAGLEICEYSPRLIKQTVVGYGNAEKHQVQEMVRLLLSLKSVPSPHDAADALAVAICHFHHAAFKERIAAVQVP
jgi:crossover junction endodeoxyribonuclease RuvC